MRALLWRLSPPSGGRSRPSRASDGGGDAADAHAPAAEWLGGYTDPNGRVVRSLEGISQRMPAGLRMLESCDLPKVVREDARHFRLEVVEVSLWRRDA